MLSRQHSHWLHMCLFPIAVVTFPKRCCETKRVSNGALLFTWMNDCIPVSNVKYSVAVGTINLKYCGSRATRSFYWGCIKCIVNKAQTCNKNLSWIERPNYIIMYQHPFADGAVILWYMRSIFPQQQSSGSALIRIIDYIAQEKWKLPCNHTDWWYPVD